MSFEELDGEKIGVIKGQAIGEKILRQYPGFNFQRYLTIEEMIKGLEKDDVDVIVDATTTVGYYLKLLDLEDIKLVGDTPYRNDIAIGVRNDWPEFIPILNKALNEMEVVCPMIWGRANKKANSKLAFLLSGRPKRDGVHFLLTSSVSNTSKNFKNLPRFFSHHF